MLVSQLSPGHQNDGTNFRNAPGGILGHHGRCSLVSSALDTKMMVRTFVTPQGVFLLTAVMDFLSDRTKARPRNTVYICKKIRCTRVSCCTFSKDNNPSEGCSSASLFLLTAVMDFLNKVPHPRYESFVPECTLALHVLLARPDFRLSWIILDSKKRVIPLASLAF